MTRAAFTGSRSRCAPTTSPAAPAWRARSRRRSRSARTSWGRSRWRRRSPPAPAISSCRMRSASAASPAGCAPPRSRKARASVYANLEASAERHPAKTAIDFYGTRITYAELKRAADALAGFLQQRCSVRRGDRVLMYLQNSPQFVIAYYAILRADAVVVPVNLMNRTEELRHYVE